MKSEKKKSSNLQTINHLDFWWNFIAVLMFKGTFSLLSEKHKDVEENFNSVLSPKAKKKLFEGQFFHFFLLTWAWLCE